MNLTAEFLKLALNLGAQWVMYLLLGCSIFSFAIIIDRILYFRKISGDFAEFIQGLTQRLNSDDSIDKTAGWCASQKMLEANVAAIGLENHIENLRTIEESMNATMIAAKTKLERGATILATLGNNTPFLGLLGTVIGIITAFNSLAQESNGVSESLMASISEALVSTALGLLVAIPAVVAYNFLTRSIKRRMANSDTTARIVLSYLSKQSKKD
ncbi:MAG: MotA/TolQ/ExbB proton channel family protein [Silvanigrellaceae bacterium]|nr:MotA/TolQ/ExbB proton channel family protein [Silvanigrellaceae bacterium]